MTTDSPEASALAKLRTFIGELDPDERVVIASLLAPAVAQAFDTTDDAEVQGFAFVEWRPTIPETLAQHLRTSGMQVTLSDE
jgi:hypothetical protein